MVGPEGTGRAIILVYDIFGYFPQTLQGADILAEACQARVLMPDFFKGKPFPPDKHPPKDEADAALLQLFFGTTANPISTLPSITAVGKELKKEGASKVGVVGFCWGGKMAIKSGSEGFADAVAAIHPAMLSAGDTDDLTVPLALFPSKDEPIEEYQKMVDALEKKPFASKNAYKVYSTAGHGFAAARANLADPEGKKQYEDVYGRTATFFNDVFVA